jgi:hypothetical protein
MIPRGLPAFSETLLHPKFSQHVRPPRRPAAPCRRRPPRRRPPLLGRAPDDPLRPVPVRQDHDGRGTYAACFAPLARPPNYHTERVTRALVRWRQVRAWVNESDIPETLRATPGVQDVQFSFCPGEGWLAARYIFDDLDDLRASFEAEAFTSAEAKVTAHPLYDASREPHIFKGFFLPEV